MSRQSSLSQVAAGGFICYFFSSFLHWCRVFYSNEPAPLKNGRVSSAHIADYIGFLFVWQDILPIFSPLVLSCPLSARIFCLDPCCTKITWIICCCKMLIFCISSNGYTILNSYRILLVARCLIFYAFIWLQGKKRLYI